jgi:HlyD family secretion protein
VKKLLWAVVLLAVFGAGAYYYYHRSKAIDYTTAKIERGDIESSISATGNCNAVVTVQVGSQVSGNIQALYADFNTKVKKGQLVARIEPTLFQAKVDQMKAALDSAKASVVNAQASVKRAEADLASAQANVANQNANVVRAQSAVDDAKTKSDRRKVAYQQGIIDREDMETAQATYDQAVANLAATKAQVTASLSAVASSQAQREVAVTQLASAQAQVKQAEANLQSAQVDLDHTEIRAPVDGTVIARSMDVGQTVAASFSAPTIFQIAQDLTKMQVDANIDESDIGRVMVGQQVTFGVDAYPGTVFHGDVTQIRQAPINVQNVITYDVVITVDNSDLKLLPGMTANVRISTDKLSGVIKIPSAALRFRPAAGTVATTGDAKKGGGGGFGGKGGGNFQGKGKGTAGQSQVVYTLNDQGEPQPHRVRLGIGDGNFVAMSNGDLKEGDLIITGVANPTASTTGAFPGQQQPQQGGFKGKGPGF